MSIEVSPVGVACNLSCSYCYEHPIREAGNFNQKPYDLEKMINGLAKEGGPFGLFGGEPLLTDLETLEGLWKFGFERYKRNGIQTNGTLINDKHIELFKKYNVHVGISMDGPDELNDTRWAGSLEETRRRTKMSMDAIERLSEEKIQFSLIVTLTRLNSTPEQLPRLKEWFRYLDTKGVNGVRLHTLEVEYDSVGETFSLTPGRSVEVMLEMAHLEHELKNYRFDMFTDIKNLLVGRDSSATCTFRECDPYTTKAVRGINGQGEKQNCGRSTKEGVVHLKADQEGFERQMALYLTPQEHGGCQGCRFFIMCKGQCPGGGMNYDWRNRSVDCELYYALFSHFENDYLNKGILPLSQSPVLKQMEQMCFTAWTKRESADFQKFFNILQ
jgi:uncharacterized protein